MRHIADYLGNTTWHIECRICRRWRSFPPVICALSLSLMHLKLEPWQARARGWIASMFANAVWKLAIGENRIYGGPMAHRTSIRTRITRLVSRRSEIFLRIVRSGMMGQMTSISQVVELFRKTNTDHFSEIVQMPYTSHQIQFPLMPTRVILDVNLTWIPALNGPEKFSNYPSLISQEKCCLVADRKFRELMPNTQFFPLIVSVLL